jgi:ATP-dependent helicase IRC3
MAEALALRPYQVDAVRANLTALDQGARALTVMPTGVGKTVIACAVIRTREGSSLTLVHREELITQTLDKLMLAGFAEHELGVIKAERDDVSAPHIVASVQTLAHERRRQQLRRPRTVWVDEAHHAAAPTYLAILDELGCFGADGPATFGTTATPDRLDKLGLDHVFDRVVYEAGLLPMIRQGYLSDIRAKRVVLPVDLDAVHRRGGDLVESELAAAFEAIGAPALIASAYVQYARGRKAIVFVPSVALAHATAARLRERQVAAEALDGTTRAEDRRAILRRLHTGETPVIANCMVLSEGFDESSIECIVMARPTASRGLYQQCIGRGLRPWPNKDDCLVLDLVGNSDRHQLVTTASLLGLNPRMVEQQGVLHADADREQARVRADGLLRGPVGGAEEVDILGRKDFVWTRVGSAHVLPAGDEGWIGVDQVVSGAWRVLRQATYKGPLVVVFETRDQGYALGRAEDLVRRSVDRVLRDRGAQWRSHPMSDKQRGFFERYRLSFDPSWTKGEAGDRQASTIARWSWPKSHLA